jgi:type II secretory pathway predicted ATPase ExeA
MYEAFFGLRERPFDLTPNPRFLVMTEGHREALSNLEYGIASRKGVTLLIGEAGTGKTTIIRTALAKQTSKVTCVHLNNPALARHEFVEMLAAQFNLSAHARTSKAAFLLEFEALLRERKARDEATVLIIDEGQSLSYELLEEVRLLANIETDDQKLLSLIIAGQPELAAQLNQDSLRQLKQRVALRCELRPLTMPETLGYIAGRIRAAGGVASNTFTREAVVLLHEHARGIPRAINVLADNALVAGFARNQKPVNRAAVAEVARDFHADLPSTPTAASFDATPDPVREVAEQPAPVMELTSPPESISAPEEELESAMPSSLDEPAAEQGGRFGSMRRRFSILKRLGTA